MRGVDFRCPVRFSFPSARGFQPGELPSAFVGLAALDPAGFEQVIR